LNSLRFGRIAGILLEADAVWIFPAIQIIDRKIPVAVKFLRLFTL
jgi:hypothetical protein